MVASWACSSRGLCTWGSSLDLSRQAVPMLCSSCTSGMGRASPNLYSSRCEYSTAARELLPFSQLGGSVRKAFAYAALAARHPRWQSF